MKRIALAMVLVVLLAAPARAGFDEGVAGLQRGDFAAAFREFKPLAESGNARAQFNLGVMHTRGLGVSRDDAEAVKWYHRAAEQGDAGAQYSLGVMYAEGKGVPRDLARAVEWYRLAAAQGFAMAMNNPGPIDGIMGPKTRRAIRAFEAASKLPVTGKPSLEFLREIEQAGAE